MPRLVPIPHHLHGKAFRPKDPSAAELTAARLRGRDVQRPFHGVRAIDVDTGTWLGRCHAYAPRLRPGQYFSHTTAALLHHIPLPLQLETQPQLHVMASPPTLPPRTVGVVGHVGSSTIAFPMGLPAASAIDTWCQLASQLTIDELVAVGDFLISGRRTDVGREPALATITELHAAVAARRGRRGVRSLAASIAHIRERVDSAAETRLRLLLVRSGLPEPLINEPTFDSTGSYLGSPDMKYPEARVALEYEGDIHRVNRQRFRSDIHRRERFEDAGWRVRRVTADDLGGRSRAFIESLRALLARRGMQLP